MFLTNILKTEKSEAKVLATSMTALLFIVIGGSGILMFFHLFESRVKELHEILGLLFVAAILFHLFYNWGSMRRYFSKQLFLLSALAVIITTAVFVFNAGGGENPKALIIESVLAAPFEEVSHLLGVDPEDAKRRLDTEGITHSGQGSITDIAETNKRSPFEVIQLIHQKEK